MEASHLPLRLGRLRRGACAAPISSPCILARRRSSSIRNFTSSAPSVGRSSCAPLWRRCSGLPRVPGTRPRRIRSSWVSPASPSSGALASSSGRILIARRTGLTISSQVAVVAVERIFDLGAFGLIFSLDLRALTRQLQTLPYLRTLPKRRLHHRRAHRLPCSGSSSPAVRLAGAARRHHQRTNRRRRVSFISPREGENAAEKSPHLPRRSQCHRQSSPILSSPPLLSLATLWLTVAASLRPRSSKSFPSPLSPVMTVADTIAPDGLQHRRLRAGPASRSRQWRSWAGQRLCPLRALRLLPADLAGSAGLMLWAHYDHGRRPSRPASLPASKAPRSGRWCAAAEAVEAAITLSSASGA